MKKRNKKSLSNYDEYLGNPEYSFVTNEQYMKTGGKTDVSKATKQINNNLKSGEPNVEVEDGEVLKFPDGVTHAINGKKHHEGGEEIRTPDNTKIFSDFLKVDKDVIDDLGIKREPRKKYSFADVAKYFDTKKHQVKLDNSTSDLDKTTAQLMIDRNNKALDSIFNLQQQVNGKGITDNQDNDNQVMQKGGVSKLKTKDIGLKNTGINDIQSIDTGNNPLSKSIALNRTQEVDQPIIQDQAQAPKEYKNPFPWAQLAPAAYQLATNSHLNNPDLLQNNYKDTIDTINSNPTNVDLSGIATKNTEDYRAALQQLGGNDPALQAQLYGQKLQANQQLGAEKTNIENQLRTNKNNQLADIYANRDQGNLALKDQYNVRKLQGQENQKEAVGNALQSIGNVNEGYNKENKTFDVAKQMYKNVNWVKGKNGSPEAVVNGIKVYFGEDGKILPIPDSKKKVTTKTNAKGQRETQEVIESKND